MSLLVYSVSEHFLEWGYVMYISYTMHDSVTIPEGWYNHHLVTQLEEHQSAEQDVVGLNPGWTINQGL